MSGVWLLCGWPDVCARAYVWMPWCEMCLSTMMMMMSCISILLYMHAGSNKEDTDTPHSHTGKENLKKEQEGDDAELLKN